MKAGINILLGIILLCVGAQTNIVFSESLAFLSISMISLAVLLLPFLFSKLQAFAVVIGYICLAITGLPVLSSGLTGIDVLKGPTFGYILGFIVTIYWLSGQQNPKDTFWKIVAWFILGHFIILMIGVPYYYFHNKSATINQLVWPFMPGLAVKSLLGAGIVTSFRHYKNKT